MRTQLPTKEMTPIEGGRPIKVALHVILSNLWEYYLEQPDQNGNAFGYVMGAYDEHGSVNIEELKSHAVSISFGNDLTNLMPASGYTWKEDEE